ncbi:MAG: HAD family hydrolase [Anaerolineae bacterium]|nr:HAD family hydrolase [Anaerolineae bacterium]
MPLRGVIFDMGGTLLHYNAPNSTWEDTEQTGARGVYAVLREHGYTLPPKDEALPAAWDHAFGFWSNLDEHDVKDLKIAHVIGLLIKAWGVANAPAEVVNAAANAYMRTIQEHVRPLDGAATTLQTLRDQGLRVGLLSNTMWPGNDHRRDLDRYALTPYLEHLIFSADVDAWKPHGEVFQMSLDALDLQPDEAIYVGDRLYFDVWGAQQAGLRGVWIEQHYHFLPKGMTVTPDATIQTLPALLDVIKPW